jgi:antitoxin component of MazEF toxin-antitoxin module
MLTNLIRMGDSCGVSIPAALAEQIGLEDAVEILVEKGRLIIQPQRFIGKRWEAALFSLAERVDNAATLGEIPDLPSRCAS